MAVYKRILLFCSVCLFVFFLARLALLSIYWEQFKALSFAQIVFAFVYGARFDLSSIIVFLSIPLLLVSLPFRLFRRKAWQAVLVWIMFLILLVLAFGLVGDIIYFDFVKRHTTNELLILGVGDVTDVGGMIFGVFLPYLFGYLLVMAGVFYLWKKASRIQVRRNVSKFEYIAYFVFIFVLVIAGRGGFGYKPIAIIDAYAVGNTRQGDLVLNGVFSASQSMIKDQNVEHSYFEDEEVARILGMNETLPLDEGYPLKKRSKKTPAGYNLVFVLFESLTYEYVDSFGENDFGVTPNLDTMTREGVKFVNFYASGQRSVEGIQATLTGIPSIVGMPTISTGMVAKYSKLGELGKQNGYATFFSQTSARGSLRVNSIAKSTGFEEYYGMEDMPPQLDYPDPKSADWGWDYENFMKMADRIEQTTKPFISYIITSTTHTPYPRLPEGFEKYAHETNGENGFLNTMFYTDWCIGEFIKRSKKMGWFEDTIFVFTADHTFRHSNRISGIIPNFRIPLVIYSPHIYDHKTIHTVGSQVDILPTIIDVLGLEGEYSSFGASLFSPDRKDFALIRGGSVMGIITDKAYLSHSLSNRLESVSIGEPMPEDYFDLLEKRLLASVQQVNHLIKVNRWVN